MLLLLILSRYAAAQQPSTLTVAQAVAMALEKNPLHKAAMAEQRVAQADVREARSAFLPRIAFSEGVARGNDPVFAFGTRLRQGRFTDSDFALNRLNHPAPISDFSTRFGGQWNVFDSFASSLSLRRARQMNNAAAQQLARSDQETVFRVIQAYHALLLAGKQQELAEQTVKTAQSVLELSQARVQAGTVVESDLLAAQVNLATRRQELIRARNAVAMARAQLSVAIGLPDGAFDAAAPLQERVLPNPALAEAETQALQQRPDLKQIASQTGAQETGVRLAKAAFGPRVNLIAGWEMDKAAFAGNGGNNWVAGAEVQFDLFAGGQKVARLSREKALLDRAGALQQAAKDGVRLEVRRAYYDYDAARQTMDVARTVVAQAEEGLRINQNRYDAGLITITDLLRAEDAARGSRTTYWESVSRYQTSYAALELAVGSLNPQSAVVTQ